MDAQELLEELSVKIYEPPLSELRSSGAIRDLSNPVCVLMLLLDFDTEVMMGGISSFIGNSTGLYADETVTALELVGCADQARTLRKILTIASSAGMTYHAIQADMTGLEPGTVITFRQVHGDKWDQVIDDIRELSHQIDHSHMWRKAEDFLAHHQQEVAAALGQSDDA